MKGNIDNPFVIRRAVSAIVMATVSSLSSASVALQNATATFSQPQLRPWNASEMIDGDLSVNNGWAINRASGLPSGLSLEETVAFETLSNLNAPGLIVQMIQNYSANPGHFVGRFRLSYTTDDRDEFADGLQTGGDVTANWTVLTPTSVATTPGFSSTILGDGSVLMALTGAPPLTAVYTIGFSTALAGVTGFRLEVLEDPSLPGNGPGMWPNGNFVLTEVVVEAVPEPATMAVLGVGALALIRRRRKAR